MRQHYYILSIITFILCFGVSVPTSAQGTRQELLTRINALRADLGLSPYSLNSALNAAALNHAQWMVATSQVTHIQDNGSSPSSRAQASGYNSQWVSENIYMGGLASVDTAWTFWVNSPIHYAGLTSANYQDIGIASANGAGGRAYVLVFGVPSGGNPITTSSGNNGDVAAPAPPIAIVGYDEVGNIQYQLQAGDTLGQVLLLFGYTWDDLNNLLDLNELTEADITNMAIGEIILVPPPQGTYTPTPELDLTEEVEVTAEVTEPAEIATDVPTVTNTANAENRVSDGILPTPMPESETVPTLEASVVASPTVIEEQVGQAVTFVAVTASPSATQTATTIPTLQVNVAESTTIAQVASPTPTLIEEEASLATDNNQATPLWLIGAIILQVGIFGYACFEGIRRWRKS
ncbi:MAG: CAP domain-containing protein [Chloroflexota bacterium]